LESISDLARRNNQDISPRIKNSVFLTQDPAIEKKRTVEFGPFPDIRFRNQTRQWGRTHEKVKFTLLIAGTLIYSGHSPIKPFFLQTRTESTDSARPQTDNKGYKTACVR
jgi:hypothetical protein